MEILARRAGPVGEIVDSGQWTVDGGQWTVDSGRWTVDGGRWTVDSVLFKVILTIDQTFYTIFN